MTLLELNDFVSDANAGLADADVRGRCCDVYSTISNHDLDIDPTGPEGYNFTCGFPGYGFKHYPTVGSMVLSRF